MDVQTIIEYGHVARQFVDSTAGKALLDEMGARYVAEWKAAQTPQDRENAWALARALDNVRLALRAVADAGEFEQHTLDKANKK